MRFVRGSPAPALAALVAIAAIVAGASDSARAGADAQKGNAAFVSHGCWECDGFNGQGGEASNGKVIARTPLPLDAFVADKRRNAAIQGGDYFRRGTRRHLHLSAITAAAESGKRHSAFERRSLAVAPVVLLYAALLTLVTHHLLGRPPLLDPLHLNWRPL